MYFHIQQNSEGYSSRTSRHVEADSATEAYSLARETLHTVVSKLDSNGWLIDEAYFSPKHPLWSKSEFLEWAKLKDEVPSRKLRRSFK